MRVLIACYHQKAVLLGDEITVKGGLRRLFVVKKDIIIEVVRRRINEPTG